MSVDSAYFPERREIDAEVNYSFTNESNGDEAIKVYLLLADGTRVELTNEVFL